MTQFYADFIRPWGTGTAFLMTLSLPAPPGWTRTFLFDRDGRDFGERERTLLDLLQPHLHRIRRAKAAAPNGALTLRETEVIALVAEGLTNREIARALWISSGTVRRHLDNIYCELDVHTRTAAVRAAGNR